MKYDSEKPLAMVSGRIHDSESGDLIFQINPVFCTKTELKIEMTNIDPFRFNVPFSQPAINKLTIETLDQNVKYVQSYQ